MNYGLIKNILGKILLLMSALMVFPLMVAIIYQEKTINIISFLIPSISLLIIGLLLELTKAKDTSIVARDGFVIVSLSWIIMSLFGCLPFIISKEIPNFFSAFFEITSGFTTTGSTILSGDEIEALSHSMLFWRSFSHWIGGMGILVFILAFIPESKDGTTVHILRAESTGPKVGKLVSKMRLTSRILYLIYIALSLIMFIILILLPDEKMTPFEAITTVFGTAGTGGFANHAESIGYFANCSQYVIAIFMLIFGVNFSLYYLILIGQWKEVLKNEELRWYLIIVAFATLSIFGSIIPLYDTLEEGFRQSFFHVSSIISTTGYAISDYAATWPAYALGILTILTIFGSCAGSTAGGLKMSRLAIITKATLNDIEKMVSPRKVKKLRMDSKPLSDDVVGSVKSFVAAYAIVLVLCALLISIYNPNMEHLDVLTSVTSSLTCISNVGPGLGLVGPSGNFSGYSAFSKMILSFEMIAGRLEIFPLLIFVNPKTWIKR